MTIDRILELLAAMSRKMEEQRDYLTELDNAIADGDHGINMARGFAAVEQKMKETDWQDAGALFKTVGMTLVSVVGGSAGPLYGTAFMRAGMAMTGKSDLTMDDLIACLGAAIEGVMMRGKAVRGEKTMLDAMIPALDAMTEAHAAGHSPKECVQAGIRAAWDGVEYTKTIAATKGRASYIGERSIGHADPGATSFTYLLETVADAL